MKHSNRPTPRIRRWTILFFLTLSQTGIYAAQPPSDTSSPWSVRMAETVMKRNADLWSIDFNTRPTWNYTYGLVFKALWEVWEKTGDRRVFDYIESYYDQMIDEEGNIAAYNLSDYNIDMINPGKLFFDLRKATGNEKYRTAAQTLRRQMRRHPRTREGGFWHKKIYSHQMWLDGVYMASPFLARYAAQFNEPALALFDDVVHQVFLIEVKTRDEKTGLLYHAWDESGEQKWANPETGCSPHFWGRAMGWYAMALVDVLDYLPENHPGRPKVIAVMDRLFTALANYQDETTGLWYQVVDQGGREGNYLEATASNMYVYAMAKAARMGYVDARFMDVARKGYQGILDNFITTDAEGLVSISRCCAVAGLGGDPYRDGSYEYYINEEIRGNDPKAIGPFILASLEMERP